MAQTKPIISDGPGRRARRMMRELNRKPFDPVVKRYYVYRLIDAEGQVLYIGRSCDPLGRLKQHHATRGIDWPRRVVQIEGFGPFNWADVLVAERDAIMAERPPFNKEFVITKTHRAPALIE